MINEIMKLVSDYFGLPTDKIKPESTFTADLGLQSYSLIELCCELESRYDIEIPEDDIVNIETVNDLSNYIEKAKEK